MDNGFSFACRMGKRPGCIKNISKRVHCNRSHTPHPKLLRPLREESTKCGPAGISARPSSSKAAVWLRNLLPRSGWPHGISDGFPSVSPTDQSEDHADPTDLDWLICAIRWMQIDILAVQESLATPEATKAWDRIIASLNQQTGDTWRWYRQPCGRPEDHHVGLLWNDTRVSLSQFESLWQFNARAKSANNACTFGLRPGQYAWVQAREPNGVDFHLIGLHLKSGPTVFAVEDRHHALNRIDEAIDPLLARDRDVIILGDFNTMGAGDWQSRDSELKNLRRKVAKEKPGFVDLTLHPQCSHYFRGRGGWLDHVLVPQEMQEVTVTTVQVTGYCAVAGCERIRGNYPLAYRQLSDHCPVVLEIENT